MQQKTPLFRGFHRKLFGRPPVSKNAELQRGLEQADKLCLRQLGALLGGLLPDALVNFKAEQGDNSRKRIYTVMVTFWAFLSQVLDADGCCVRAVSRVQALFSLRKLPAPDEDTGAYCRARARLPIRLLIKAARFLADKLCPAIAHEGGRLLVMDGTDVTLPDSKLNRAQYAYPSGQKKGCGFPLMKLVGLFDLRSGAWLATVKCAGRSHDAALAWRMLKHFRAGDILVADRGFCSYAFIVALQARGVQVVMRLHQRRPADMRRGKPLGRGDRLQSWGKPAQCPKGQHPARHKALPATLPVRVVKVEASEPGYRTTHIHLATTLMDTSAWTSAQIAALYLRRWQVELFFDDIKTTMGMDMLRTRSPHMVVRELLMHMIAYNVVRHLMAQAEPLRPLESVGALSFKGARDRFAQWQWTVWSAPNGREARERCAAMLQTIANDPVPQRPGRREPRCVKRRPKPYQLLTKPRAQMRELTQRQRRCRAKPKAA